MIKLQKNLFGGEYPLTQLFGENPSWYKKYGLAGHNGLDYGLPSGTPLYSCIDGKVTEVEYDKEGYGKYIKIENDGCGVIYAHMKALSPIPVGETVYAGHFLGPSGNSGNSTDSHLHFGIFPKPRDRSNGYAGYINPLGPGIEWVDNLKDTLLELKDTVITWRDFEGNSHNVGFYVYEWGLEKRQGSGLVKDVSRKIKDNERLQNTIKTQLLQIIEDNKKHGKRYELLFSEKEAVEAKLESLALKYRADVKLWGKQRKEIRELKDKLEEKGEGVGNNMNKSIIKASLWETIKFPLRVVLFSALPALAAYFETLPSEWASTIAISLILLDKFLHEFGKIAGKDSRVRGISPF